MHERWQRWCAGLTCALLMVTFGVRLGRMVQVESPTVAAFAAEDDMLFVVEKTTAATESTSPASVSSPSLSPQETPAGETAFQLEVVHTAPEERKRVLIYHTHTYEAYQQDEQHPYAETEKWRTADAAYNVQRIGDELAALLTSLGMAVVHDTGIYEPPELSSAYKRSLDMLKERQARGEKYDLYIDLHRDAYVASQAGDNAVMIGGVSTAKLMLLIGKGEGQTDAGFEEKPQWQANLAVAQRLTDELNAQADGLCKPVRVKSGRFNQHVAVGCVLIEVGNNRNTLAEALAAMPYLADAIHETLR